MVLSVNTKLKPLTPRGLGRMVSFNSQANTTWTRLKRISVMHTHRISQTQMLTAHRPSQTLMVLTSTSRCTQMSPHSPGCSWCKGEGSSEVVSGLEPTQLYCVPDRSWAGLHCLPQSRDDDAFVPAVVLPLLHHAPISRTGQPGMAPLSGVPFAASALLGGTFPHVPSP